MTERSDSRLDATRSGSYKRGVASVAIWRWVLVRLAREPFFAVLSLCLLAVLPLAAYLRPIATSRSALELGLPWLFPAALVGASAGLVSLSRGRAFLRRLDPRTRFQGELGALLLAGAYLQVPILVGLLLSGAGAADVGRSVPAILTADLHLGGLALLFLIPVLSTALRVGLLVAAVWIVPALCSANASLARLAALLDAGAILRPPGNGVLSALAAACASVLAAYLLRTGRAPAAWR